MNKLTLVLTLAVTTPALAWNYGDPSPYGYGGYRDYGRGGESVIQRSNRRDEEDRQSRAARWVEQEQIRRGMERGEEIKQKHLRQHGLYSSPSFP